MEEEVKKYDIAYLNKLYSEAESADSDVFAEMRSNTLMVSGQHYKKISRGLDNNLRGRGVEKSKRLRLVKNHTAKAMSDIRDIFASMTPGVLPYPANASELADQKAAELAKSVWLDGQRKNNFGEKISEFRNSFTTLGEACSKVYFDPTKGRLKAYKQKVDQDGNNLFTDPNGQETTESGYIDPMTGQQIQFQPLADETKPVFSGLTVIEKFEAYNLLRLKNSKSIRDSRALIYRKMVETGDAKALIDAAPDLSKEEREQLHEYIKGASETTYKVFDGATGSFQDSDGQVMFREYYFRQSPEFPKGYYFITTEKGILFQGEIPFGEHGEIAFPIKWAGCELYDGSARGFSYIKRIRPCQLEINRCSSATSETQITVGWDKVILQKGAKFSRGVDQPGMRVFYSTDGTPTLLPGRSGDQFIPYLEYNVNELYKLVNIPENSNPIAQGFDPKAELFKRQSQKARFTESSTRFANFLVENCEAYLFLASKYMSEEDLIAAVGKKEAPNIKEFKNVDCIDYKVKLLEVSDDLDSMMAKTLELETIVQYMGKNMDEETAKAVIAQFPILNKTQALKHLTMELDNINSDILALDRGEEVRVDRDDDHALFVRHLTHRMKRRDFRLLDKTIQQKYMDIRKQHQMFIAQIGQEEQAAQAGFIPSGGALVKVNMYHNPDPTNPGKSQLAMAPVESIQWLLKRLAAQGSGQEMLASMGSAGAAADVGLMMNQNQQGMPPQGQMPIIQGAM